MREKGRTVKNPETGAKETIPGTLKAVRAVGWYIPEYQMAQISVNLLNYNITPLHRVFEEAERLAAEFGVRVTGSELVGLIPLEAVLQAGRHYLRKQGGCLGVSEKELVRTAVQSLGLAEISPFKPEHKIIEYRFRKKGPLVSMDLVDFCAELASDSPAPGGGSIAALNGALSAGLSAMVGNLTFGKKGYEEVREEMEIVAEKAQPLKDFFIEAIDKDTEAFNCLMAAFSLPKKTDEEKKIRQEAVDRSHQGGDPDPLRGPGKIADRGRAGPGRGHERQPQFAFRRRRGRIDRRRVRRRSAVQCPDQHPGDGCRFFPQRNPRPGAQDVPCVLETAAKIKAFMDKGLAD